MKSPSFFMTVRREVFSISTLFITIFVGSVYLFSVQLFLNYKLLFASFSYGYPLSSILNLLFSLLLGSFTSFSAEPFAFSVLILNAFFVGLNLMLLARTIHGLQVSKRVHISLGGAALFSLVTAGCASCGLSLLSVLGLSATLTFLPFHGAELRVISLGLLLLSAFYMIQKLHEAKYCKV